MLAIFLAFLGCAFYVFGASALEDSDKRRNDIQFRVVIRHAKHLWATSLQVFMDPFFVHHVVLHRETLYIKDRIQCMVIKAGIFLIFTHFFCSLLMASTCTHLMDVLSHVLDNLHRHIIPGVRHWLLCHFSTIHRWTCHCMQHPPLCDLPSEHHGGTHHTFDVFWINPNVEITQYARLIFTIFAQLLHVVVRSPST